MAGETNGVAGDLPARPRLSVTHPDGRAKAVAVFTNQVKPAIQKAARSADPSKSAALVAIQLVGMAFLRYVLHFPAVVEPSREDLVRNIGNTTQRYLDGR